MVMIVAMPQDSATRGQPLYRVFRLGGRPIFAAPASPRGLRLAGLARFQPFTPRRAAYQRLMRLSMLLGVDRLLSIEAASPIAGPIAFEFAAWLERVREDLNQGDLAAVVFWPPQRDRGRVYVHLFNANTRPVGFAKLSFDEANDAALRNESRTLAELSAMNLRRCRVPSVLSAGRAQGHEYLIVEPVPATARPIADGPDNYPRQSVDEFAGQPRAMRGAELSRLSWWPRFLARVDESCRPFVDELMQLTAGGFSVRRAHGDFGHANLLHADGTLWILDWEESCADAPAATDEISFRLAMKTRRFLADPIGSAADFAHIHLAGQSSQRRIDVMLALAFRLGVGMQDAAVIIRNWNQLP